MERRGSAVNSFASEAVPGAGDGEQTPQDTPVKVRRPTVINAADNPFIKKEAGSPEPTHKKIETLTSCRKITHEELLDLIDVLDHVSDNPSRLVLLEHQKQPYLFSSADLLELMHITESVKTRIAMIEAISPRLTDPTARVADFINLFRFVEEKNHVEEALKARAHQLASKQFTAGPAGALMTGGRGGGRGGGGGPTSPGGPLGGGGRGGRGGRGGGGGAGGGGGGGGGGVSGAVVAAEATSEPPPPPQSPPSTPAATPVRAEPAAEPVVDIPSFVTVVATPEPQASVEPLKPPSPVAEPSQVTQPTTAERLSPRVSVSHVRPSSRTSVTNPDIAVETVDAIPSAMGFRDSEARAYIMTPDNADPNNLTDIVPSESPPSPMIEPSPTAVSRRASLRQSMADPVERERNSERLSERLSKVEIAVVLAALNMPEDEVKEKEAELEDWEMAVVEEKTEEANHRRSVTAGGGIMRRLSNIIFGVKEESVDDSAVGSPSRSSFSRRSISSRASENDASSRVHFGSTVSAPDSTQYGVSSPLDGDYGDSSKNDDLSTPSRRNSARIFSPTRPSPSKSPSGSSWFSFKGISTVFTPEKQSQEYKYASALAYSLNMDRNAFLAMEPETSIEDDEDGNPLYSYKELLRRQYTKMYLGLPIDSLEKYLTESEFNFHFRLTKEKFYAQPRWKQIAQKKALMLF